jgi:glycerol-1-phosphate dehydrogenase [NAD(P)+]
LDILKQAMSEQLPVRAIVIEPAALKQTGLYLTNSSISQVLLVADHRTYDAAGRELAGRLASDGLEVSLCLLEDQENGQLPADETSIVQLMEALSPEHEALIAVGSGTIHDIVRFVSHRAGKRFISVPTAPSVDGFSSVGAPIILRGFKQTVPACAPEAIFADLHVLAAAPQSMVAAGFADMLGKYTSLADWRLGHLLFNEPYDSYAAQLTEQGLRLCVDHVADIAARSESGMRRLMEGLILSGIAMLSFGSSRPASGGEHHLSHFWEMSYLTEGRPALLHGAKVGVACVLMAELYERIARTTVSQLDVTIASGGLELADSSKIQEEWSNIVKVYGKISPAVMKENGWKESFAKHPILSSGSLEAGVLYQRIRSQWDKIQTIARMVPKPQQIAGWLEQTGGPAYREQLSIPDDMLSSSMRYAMYVRNRFTVLRLHHLLSNFAS